MNPTPREPRYEQEEPKGNNTNPIISDYFFYYFTSPSNQTAREEMNNSKNKQKSAKDINTKNHRNSDWHWLQDHNFIPPGCWVTAVKFANNRKRNEMKNENMKNEMKNEMKKMKLKKWKWKKTIPLTARCLWHNNKTPCVNEDSHRCVRRSVKISV